jgi:predicted protein tyrosine phosphatase
MLNRIKDFEMPFSELKVLSEAEARGLCMREPNKWNVVSLWADIYNVQSGKLERIKPEFEDAKRLRQEFFHDIVRPEKDFTMCDQEHIRRILKFGRMVRGEPVCCHCAAGISRSTAVAILLVLDAIKDKSEQPFEDALDIVYRIRPIMQPNRHILEIGIPLIVRNEEEQMSWYRNAYNSGVMREIRGK